MMDRPTFLAACRRRALEIALGHDDLIDRSRALGIARKEMLRLAAEIGIDGGSMRYIFGPPEEGHASHPADSPVLPDQLHHDIGERFGYYGFEFRGEFTGHQKVRMRIELRRLECADV